MTPPVTRPNRSRRAAAAAVVAGTLALNACFTEDPLPDVNHPVESGPCVDVPVGVRAQADSLVNSGNREMVGNFQYWFDSNDWWAAKGRTPEAALSSYEKALALAPGHCQAKFGRAMASASLITQDKRMDDFIRKLETADRAAGEDIGLAKKGSFSAVFKTTPDQGPTVVAKLYFLMNQVDQPTVKKAQTLIEAAIMPRLDSTIAALEAILEYRMFAVRFDVDGRTYEIDHSEIGPGLAGLKVAKAWLTVVAGYNLDYTPAEGYDLGGTFPSADMKDFDHLTPDHTRALDHVTGLFKAGSPFTRQKPSWKARIHAIPDLLLEAVGDAQKGLESSIAEARNGDSQTFDVWRAGTGEDDDIDTADLRGAIQFLERSKKFLTGEAAVEFARGTRMVKVNLPRLFHVDGVQGMLPYFKFLPYAQWNDTAYSDTTWGPWLWSRDLVKEILSRSGYDPALVAGSRDGSWRVRVESVFGLEDTAGIRNPFRLVLSRLLLNSVTGFLNFNDTTLAEYIPDSADPCTIQYFRVLSARITAEDKVDAAPETAAAGGTATLSGCRMQGGQIEYIDHVITKFRGPFEFTDAQGRTTLTIPEMDATKDAKELKGKVTFSDPTFGGILPGMTNERFWDDVSALANSPGQRTRQCRDVEGPDGWTDWVCETSIPSNPSDLDYLVYYLYWMDRAF